MASTALRKMVRCEPCLGLGYKGRWRNLARGRDWKLETCRSCEGRGEREAFHVCKCRRALGEHRGSGAACPRGGGAFRPNARTVALFPEQYQAEEAS